MRDDRHDAACDHEGGDNEDLNPGKERPESKQLIIAAELALRAFWTALARDLREYAGNLEHIADLDLKESLKTSGTKTHRPDENAATCRAGTRGRQRGVADEPARGVRFQQPRIGHPAATCCSKRRQIENDGRGSRKGGRGAQKPAQADAPDPPRVS